MTRTESARVRALVLSPMATLRTELRRCTLSSNEVAAESGVPASVVRTIRNGRGKDVTSTTWSRLVWWLESQRPAEERLLGLPRFRK